jgi:transposase InsO family protein
LQEQILNSFSWPRRGEPHGCGEYNGRIERFFGTLKRTLIDLPSGFKSEEELPYLLQSFQWWYNNVRLHQNLNFQKPESVYQKAAVTAKMKPDKINKNE